MIDFYDPVFKEELSKIPPLTRETYFLTDSIACRIELFISNALGEKIIQVVQ